MKLLGTNNERIIESDMYGYLPQEYRDYRESRAIIKAEAAEFESLNSAISDLLAQFCIDTATWGLSYWEQMCGLIVNESKPIDERRSLIKARRRGTGVVTPALIQNVIDSYSGGAISITEDTANYTIKIKFVSNYGTPTNMPDIQQVIRDIMPAHLAIIYEYKYPLWSDWSAANKTWTAINTANKTWTQYESGI
ncbi:YmfQ family protein [Gottfriedia sp. S16(2024)]|uniref:YmfQ family protein n=1 Tax=Gottfriedia sp. S16(2024) TaxID=3162883 RepID=UPI003D1E6E28